MLSVCRLYMAGSKERMFNMAVTKDTIIGDVLDMNKETAPFFLEMGMHCLGCPASRGETIEQACAVHGVDAQQLIDKLNAFLSE